DKSGEKGAGLGLSIVQRIVNAHGGCCEVDDSPLGGLRFRMCLRPADQRG
ncbi:MAG: ATP-binding protein, partial [Alphaproteobacteria bacterium]